MDCIHCQGTGHAPSGMACRICEGTGQVDETGDGWWHHPPDEHHDDSEAWPRDENEAEPYLDIIRLIAG